MEANVKATTEMKEKMFEPSASYKVDKITFVVERVFREDAESVSAILTRLICHDADAP